MRKLITGIAVMAAMLIVSGATAFAVETVNGHNYVDADGNGICDYCNSSCAFVDADGDGICDNYATNGCCAAACYVDADGDGICDNYGTNGCGTGACYVDADGDGICDNYGTNACGRNAGTSQGGYHGRSGGGYGRGRHHR